MNDIDRKGSCFLKPITSDTVRIATLDDFDTLRQESTSRLQWNCPFVLPFWLKTVWYHLGGRGEPAIVQVSDGSNLLGLVPLSIDGDTAYFAGDPNVCDYQDIITVAGQGTRVMQAAIDHLASRDIRHLDLRALHADATVLQAVKTLAEQGRIQRRLSEEDVTYEMELAASWEDYLKQLSGKQRHEVRRKIRRMDAHGSYAYVLAAADGALERDIQSFLRLFQLNRSDKADFMDKTMAGYFKDLIQNLADRQMLRLHFLMLDGIAAATVLCFDFNGVRYLYNSGYDAQYHDLSVGILSKVFSIQDAIPSGCRYYDFLKGSEVYKKRIGGNLTPVYRCQIQIM